MSGSASLLAELARLTANGGGDCGPSNGTVSLHYQSVLSVAEKMRRIFQLPMPDAPGLTFVGGDFDPADFALDTSGSDTVSAAGSGMDRLRAAVSCICEAVEYLSQLAGQEDKLRYGSLSAIETGLDRAVLAQLLAMMSFDPAHSTPDIRWTEATRLCDGTKVLLPAGLCLRNVHGAGERKPVIKLSAGCGAGPTCEAALLHGLLELVERDAIAMWWLGGRRGRELPPEPANEAAAFIDELRKQTASRSTWLIDLTTDITIPTVAALSVDADERGLACGFAARLSYGDAARAAVRELCQMELGLHLIALKLRQRGEAALNKADRTYLRLAYGFDVRGCELLHPMTGYHRTMEPCDDGIDDPITVLSRRLASRGVDAFWADLTRPALGIPSVRALAVGLQPYPSSIVTTRLKRQIRETGGGFGLTYGLELM